MTVVVVRSRQKRKWSFCFALMASKQPLQSIFCRQIKQRHLCPQKQWCINISNKLTSQNGRMRGPFYSSKAKVLFACMVKSSVGGKGTSFLARVSRRHPSSHLHEHIHAYGNKMPRGRIYTSTVYSGPIAISYYQIHCTNSPKYEYVIPRKMAF